MLLSWDGNPDDILSKTTFRDRVALPTAMELAKSFAADGSVARPFVERDRMATLHLALAFAGRATEGIHRGRRHHCTVQP
jgi:hypothetical protein